MPNNVSRPGSALDGLLAILDLEPLELNLFRGRSPSDGWQRVFGGQVLGQALVAAFRTLAEERPVHSLHGYFLLGGDPTHPIIYQVERTRDGSSFTTRHVNAIQHGRIIFSMSASFHRPEEGYAHQFPMPGVPPPEGLASVSDLMRSMADKLPPAIRDYWTSERPIDLRPVDISRYLSREPGAPRHDVWFRANGTLPDRPEIHNCILAYVSDFTLLDTALIAHGKLLFDRDLQLASLDHALWFHRPVRADEWLLYAQDSPNAFGARGFCRGAVYDREGHLVASVAQEGLIRKRSADAKIKN
jgi:acyl-CoA thioesterase-2